MILKAVYIMNPWEWDRVYPTAVREELAGMVDILGPVLSPAEALARPELLEKVEVLLSGWGGPQLNERFLDQAPNLKAVFYGAGAVRHLLSDAFWNRQIVITTANAANAIPVAEFSLAHILLGLKGAWRQASETRKRRAFVVPPLPVAGAYQSTVGLISLGTIGRLVRQRLRSIEVRVIAYDPTVSTREALGLKVDMASLEELFATSDVISLHAPLMEGTAGLVTGRLLASMKPGSTFINTARGAIVPVPI
jgi:phosphoglycerate dehydrogenase-like enzyme